MHFFNPVPVMRLVEVVKGVQTNDDSIQAAKRLAQAMGKETIVCEDSPGLVSARILMPWINEAIFCLSEGIGRVEDIDEALRLGCNGSS